MLVYQNNTVRTSVRKMVEFLLREGDLVSGTSMTGDVEAMQEGARLHRKIQKQQGETYHSEVPLTMSWHLANQSTGQEYELILDGRADGTDRITYGEIDQSEEENNDHIDEEQELILIDEIKCIYGDVTQIEEAQPLHLAQAKCYAYMAAFEKNVQDIAVRITYCNIETEEIRYIYQIIPFGELEIWFYEVIDKLKIWAEFMIFSKNICMESIGQLQFPFDYRPGQRQMSAMIYQSIRNKKHLFLQAPTGIGKTISALYPSIKHLGNGSIDTIFYLTAKTITGTVAENTFRLLAQIGLRLHYITITAKDKICILDTVQCNPDSCVRAKGHYDRINEAVFSLLTKEEQITREKVLEYAQNFTVCPYELEFEAAVFCECIICDYNYVFDPHVNAGGLFGNTNKNRSVLLLDEAHNLLDRARDMYSADISKEELRTIRKSFQQRNTYIVKAIQNVIRTLTSLEREEKAIREAGEEEAGIYTKTAAMLAAKSEKLYYPLLRLLEPLKDYLKEHTEFEDRDDIVQTFFRLNHFLYILERKGEGYQIYSTGTGNRYVLRLFCVDPSACIEEYLNKTCSAIFFSATLLPIRYFRQLLAGHLDIEAYNIPSPFEKKQRLIAVTNDVTSRYSQRGERQYQRIVEYMELTIQEKAGNYMIFFPSYEMLHECEQSACENERLKDCDFLIQKQFMKEEERASFLKEFEIDRKRSLIAFCVLGSLYSEGIDLKGESLIGVMIVGTGLPKVCREREIIRTFFDTHGKKGYDYAYRYPGINKVLQAAGRVIRTVRDTGIILLMDERFLWRENQILLPQEWDSYYEVSLQNYPMVLRSFWQSQDQINE